MGEGGGRRRVGQVIGRDVHRLHRGDGPIFGRGDALLQRAHLVGQGGLVTHGGGQAPHQRGDLRARLNIPEDVVDEQQHVLALPIPEILSHGQAGQRHTHTGPGGLVHLAKDQGRLFNDAGLRHLAPQVVALAGALSHASENGIAAVLGGDVADQLLDEHSLAHAGAAKQADLATLGIGGQ